LTPRVNVSHCRAVYCGSSPGARWRVPQPHDPSSAADRNGQGRPSPVVSVACPPPPVSPHAPLGTHLLCGMTCEQYAALISLNLSRYRAGAPVSVHTEEGIMGGRRSAFAVVLVLLPAVAGMSGTMHVPAGQLTSLGVTAPALSAAAAARKEVRCASYLRGQVQSVWARLARPRARSAAYATRRVTQESSVDFGHTCRFRGPGHKSSPETTAHRYVW